ncbi:hypothetical protein F5888DRAFT_1803470 [Russula emetica]|nr:hypothetical protein F5888DRAFT_1803470 [Russula emetica]
MGTSQRLLYHYPSSLPAANTTLTESNHLSLAANLPKSSPLPGNWTSLPPDSQETTARATATNGKLGSPPFDIRFTLARPNHLTIFPCGSKSNWNREGDRQPAAGAITYINNRESPPPIKPNSSAINSPTAGPAQANTFSRLLQYANSASLTHKNATVPLTPNDHESHTVAHQKAILKALTMSAWQASWHNTDRRSEACLALPESLCPSRLPIRARQVPPSLPPSPSNREPEREWGSMEHGMAAQPFTPKLNVPSPTVSNPSLLWQSKRGRKSPWLSRRPKPASRALESLCNLPLRRHLP